MNFERLNSTNNNSLEHTKTNELTEQQARSIISSEIGIKPEDTQETIIDKINEAVDNRGMLQRIAETPALRNVMKILLLTIGLTIGERVFGQNQTHETADSSKTEQQLEKNSLEIKLANLFNKLNTIGLLSDAKNVAFKDEMKTFGKQLVKDEKERNKYAIRGNYTFTYSDRDENHIQNTKDVYEIEHKENGVKTTILYNFGSTYGWAISEEPREGFKTMSPEELNSNQDPLKYPLFIAYHSHGPYYVKFLTEQEINDIIKNIETDIDQESK